MEKVMLMEDAKSFLRQVERLDTLIACKIAEITKWRELALGITANMDGEKVQSSSPKSRMAVAVERIVDVEAEVNELVDRLIDTKRDIISTIEQLESVHQYKVIHERYIQLKTLENIADETGKSLDSVKGLHKRGVKSVQRLLDVKNNGGV